MRKPMDLRSGEIKSLYFKYLASAFGSALISCIYGVVDMAMVGQYEGPGGTELWQLWRRYGIFYTAWGF